MKRTKRTRKEPRRLTPPLFLRGAQGDREVVEVDQEIVTISDMTSGRVRAILQIAPGIRIKMGSRCINKRRVAVLRIEPADYQPAEAQPSQYAEAIAGFEPGTPA